MRKFKNKKKLTTVAVAFLLTFVVGAAFAFTPGMLDIEGAVNIFIPEGYVIWKSADVGTDSGPGKGTSHYAEQTANIVARPLGLNNQRIEWTVIFYGIDPDEKFAIAELTATAINESTVFDAEITDVRVTLDPTDAANFGLTLSESPFSAGELGVGDIITMNNGTAEASFELMWDGTVPAGFTVPATPGYALATTVTIEFDYDPV
jgi:hypothetical protein